MPSFLDFICKPHKKDNQKIIIYYNSQNKVIGVNMRKSSKNNTKSAKNQKQEKSNQNEKACK